MLVKKEVIRPGNYWYRDESTGVPRKLTVTPELTKYWCDEGNKMIGAGLTIPVPFEHDFDSHPMTPKDRLLNNSGRIKEYQREGDQLFAVLDITDPEIHKKLPHTIRWTSPWINSFTDGDGTSWKNVISHLALTTRPRVTKQEPFGSIAASLSVASPIRGWQDVGEGGVCLSRAGLLGADGTPAYPVAFSLWGGVALAQARKGKGAGGGQFTSGGGGGGTSGRKNRDRGNRTKNWVIEGDNKRDEVTAKFPKNIVGGPASADYQHLAHKGKRLKGKEAAAHLAEHGIEAKHKWFGDDAAQGVVHTRHDADTVIGNLKAGGYEHTHYHGDVNTGEQREILSHPETGHKITVMHNRHNRGSSRIAVSQEPHGKSMAVDVNAEDAAMAIDDMAKKKKAKPKPTEAESAEEEEGGLDNLEEGEEDDSFGGGEAEEEEADVFGDGGGGDDFGADPLADQAGDMGGESTAIEMEELLCDLLQALGVPMPDESNPEEFKRHLYEAVMSKIKELTSKGMGEQDGAANQKPDQNKPPGQNPHASQPNPLIQQEQQPMYMSLEEINKLPEPMRGVALAMHTENVKMRAELDTAKKVTDSLRDAKLKEAATARASRIMLLSRLSPRVKADLDTMLALPAMALSMGDGGAVVDPMAQTLAVLEKGLADLPRLLTTDASALSVQPQPQDADMLTDARADEIADGLARAMGAPAKKAS